MADSKNGIFIQTETHGFGSFGFSGQEIRRRAEAFFDSLVSSVALVTSL